MDPITKPCRVAVVGAGAGGLVVCHRLTQMMKSQSNASEDSNGPEIKQRPIEVTVFEQSNHLGGTWFYTDRTGTDENGLAIHSSMYKNLRTNFAKEIMMFIDFPLPAKGPSYIPHEEVLRYLNDYCDRNGIRKHIQFNTRVTKAWPVQSPASSTEVWHVETEQISPDKRTSRIHEFDAIAVCNGHYFLPRYPTIEGLSSFRETMHSHDYRVPEPFCNKTVLCLGAGPSAWDISLEMYRAGARVFLCNKEPLPFPFPDDIRMMPWPVSCDVDRVTFPDGEQIEDVDVILLCTGYKYSFPFLHEDEHSGRPLVRVDHGRVTPLYKHLFHIEHPSLALFGIPKTVVPFCLMDIQAQVFRKVLDGSRVLPSAGLMNAEVARQEQKNADEGLQTRKFHKMDPEKMQDYLDDLEDFGQIEDRTPPCVHKMYKTALESIQRFGCEEYRNVNYGTTHDDFFVRNLDGSPI